MEHRHTKRHTSAGKMRDPERVSTNRPFALPAATSNEGPLTTVNEEDGMDGSCLIGADDQFGSASSTMTLASLTSKHLLATTDSRSAYHGTKDLGLYQTLCQQRKSSSQVPSPYHAMESVLVQNAKAVSKSSEIGSTDTGYKSTGSSSFASQEMNMRYRKYNELQAAKHRERAEQIARIPTKNQRPPPDPSTMAAMLIEKLEQVRRAQSLGADSHYRSREDLEKEDAQSILDDHISRVFGDSPGELSPREKVSSWVLDAEKYYDLQTKGELFASQRHRLNYCRLGSMDEGLGKSINSLANSANGFGQSCSSLSSFESGAIRSTPVDEQSRRNIPPSSSSQSKSVKTNEEFSRFSNWFSLKPSKKMSSAVTTSVASNNSAATRETVSVIYQITGETLPYLSKVPGHQVTLKQFKALVPRKGKYRYYFKRICDELDVGAVFEEIVDDNETLPFWEGKISARLESISD